MRFEIPQFIDTPDKLFGPFTFKQSIYLVGGGGLLFILYKALPFFAFFLVGAPVLGLTLALVYAKPNGRPFILMMEAFIIYTLNQKFYLWRQSEAKPGAEDITQIHQPFPEEGDLPETKGQQKISDLAWSLDILDFDK